MSFRVVHLCKNNPLLERIIVLFEKAYPGNNKFYCHLKEGALGVDNHLKYTGPGFLYYDEPDEATLRDFNESIQTADLICMHGGTSVNVALLNSMKIVKPVHCFFWGFETYLHYSFFYKQIFKGTRSFLDNDSLIGKLKLLKVFLKAYSKTNTTYAFLSKVNSFSCGFDDEADWMIKNLPITKKYFPFSYYAHSINSIRFDKNTQKVNILFGNSATLTMNHIDAIPDLKKIDFNQLIIPLTYGDKVYAQFVKKHFLNHFDASRLVFIEQQMPLFEYEALMGSCHIVMINAYCQQAVGNTLNALSYGCAVFLHKPGFLYRGYTKLGYKVYDISNISSFNLQDHLVVAEQNFKVFESDRSYDRQVQLTKDILNHYLK